MIIILSWNKNVIHRNVNSKVFELIQESKFTFTFFGKRFDLEYLILLDENEKLDSFSVFISKLHSYFYSYSI